MHPVSACSSHASVVRHQIPASSAGIWDSALVLLPCQTGAAGAPAPWLAPDRASRAWGTQAPPQVLWRLPGPGRAAPGYLTLQPCTTWQSRSQSKETGTRFFQVMKVSSEHLLPWGVGGMAGVTAGQVPKANSQWCFDTQGG